MRLDIPITTPPPPPEGDDSFIRAVQAGAEFGRALARMRFDYPDTMLARIAKVHGDGTYDCDRPGTNIYMRHVPVDSLELVTPLAKHMTVLIRFYNRNRQKPRIVLVAGYPFIGLQGWVSYRMDFARRNYLSGSLSPGSPSGASLDVADPVQWRHIGGSTYIWRETLNEAEETEFFLVSVNADGAQTEEQTEKAWHDIILSRNGDRVVGLNSAAASALTGGLPTHFVHTSGQICIECRDAGNLELDWQTCLETFTIEVEDEGGIGIG